MLSKHNKQVSQMNEVECISNIFINDVEKNFKNFKESERGEKKYFSHCFFFMIIIIYKKLLFIK